MNTNTNTNKVCQNCGRPLGALSEHMYRHYTAVMHAPDGDVALYCTDELGCEWARHDAIEIKREAALAHWIRTGTTK